MSTFGFEIEEFGGETTLKVTAVPAILPRDECATALRALAQDLEGLDQGLDLREALKRIAATTACHAAVKANYPLTEEKIRHILDELRATSVFHGVSTRPSSHVEDYSSGSGEELRAHLR